MMVTSPSRNVDEAPLIVYLLAIPVVIAACLVIGVAHMVTRPFVWMWLGYRVVHPARDASNTRPAPAVGDHQ